MKKTLFSFLILFAICLLFFWPIFKGFMPLPGDLLIDNNPYRSLSVLGYTPGSYPNKAQGRDVIQEMYPWKYFAVSEMKQGRIPFWNPHNFSGNILMQNLQSSVFNPFNLFFFLFPFATGWTFFILIQPILSSWFFFLFAREMKVSRFASMVGAIGFAFSSYMSVWMEYGNIAATFAYVPLLLFFLVRFLQRQKIQDYVGFIAAGSLLLLSGYIQGAFYSYVLAIGFVVTFFLSHKYIPKKSTMLALMGMFVFPLLLTAPQIFPTVQVFKESTRWPYSLEQIQNLLQPWWYAITLFAADFFGNPAARNFYLPITYIERVMYMGVPLLFFAVYGIFQRKPFVRFFVFFAVAALLLATNIPGIAYLYLLSIPVVNTTVPTRILSIFLFSSIVLATFGIDSFLRGKKVPKQLLFFFAVVYVLLWGGTIFVKRIQPQLASQISISQHNLIVPTLLAIGTFAMLFLAKKSFTGAKIVLLFLVVIDLFYGFQRMTPFSPKQFAYPQTPVVAYLREHAGINRYWGYGSGYIPANFQTVDGTYSPEGDDPLHIKNYGELLASSYDGKLSALPPRSDANLAAGYGQDGMKNPYRQTLLNLLGVKYIVQHDEFQKDGNADTTIFSPDSYQLVWSQIPWQIYKNKKALPRFFLANNFIVANNQQALNVLYHVDLSHTLILNKKPIQFIDPHATGSVQLISYESQKIVFHTKTTGPLLLFLSDTYFPSWKAKVDSRTTPLLLADYAFRAIIVPKGVHTVTFYYLPQYFTVGILISGVGLTLLCISLVFLLRYENKQ